MRTYKYRAYMSKAQKSKLKQHSKVLNTLYNHFLGLELISLEKGNGVIPFAELDGMLPEMKQANNIDGINEIYSQVIQQVSKRVVKSIQAWKRGLAKQPVYRKNHRFFNLTYPQNGYAVMGNKFHTRIYGGIRMHMHRPIQGTIKQATVSCKNGAWYILLVTDHNPVLPCMDIRTDVGIDVGITNLVTTSDGDVFKPCKSVKYHDREANKLKSRRDHEGKTKYSKEWIHLNEVIRRMYDAKNRKKRDHLHKASKRLSSTYDAVYFEDLKVKKMSESKATGLNREMRNAGIGELFEMLMYKCRYFKQVNPHNTTKACYACGTIHRMPLRKRTMKCKCGVVIDRDLNAALNVLHLGRMVTNGLASANAIVSELVGRVHFVADHNLLLARNGPALRVVQV